MFNLGGFFGGIGRVLPGYTSGYQSAIRDNWNDLNQYNQVQAGQIANAFNEAMFNPQLSMGWDAASMSRMGTHQGAMNLAQQRQQHPGIMDSLRIQSMFMPAQTWLTNWSQLNQAMGLLGLGQQGFQLPTAQQQPNVKITQPQMGNTPTVARR